MPTKEKVANVVATAEIHLTLKIKLDSTWSGDCPTEQVFRQGRREAVQMLESVLYLGREHLRQQIAIVGTPVLKTIIGTRT